MQKHLIQDPFCPCFGSYYCFYFSRKGSTTLSTIIFAFGRQKSCLLKAMESLFDPPPTPRTLLKRVTKRPPMTHLMTNDTNDCATNVLQLSP
jgi:hypothetical protein